MRPIFYKEWFMGSGFVNACEHEGVRYWSHYSRDRVTTNLLGMLAKDTKVLYRIRITLKGNK